MCTCSQILELMWFCVDGLFAWRLFQSLLKGILIWAWYLRCFRGFQIFWRGFFVTFLKQAINHIFFWWFFAGFVVPHHLLIVTSDLFQTSLVLFDRFASCLFSLFIQKRRIATQRKLNRGVISIPCKELGRYWLISRDGLLSFKIVLVLFLLIGATFRGKAQLPRGKMTFPRYFLQVEHQVIQLLMILLMLRSLTRQILTDGTIPNPWKLASDLHRQRLVDRL